MTLCVCAPRETRHSSRSAATISLSSRFLTRMHFCLRSVLLLKRRRTFFSRLSIHFPRQANILSITPDNQRDCSPSEPEGLLLLFPRLPSLITWISRRRTFPNQTPVHMQDVRERHTLLPPDDLFIVLSLILSSRSFVLRSRPACLSTAHAHTHIRPHLGTQTQRQRAGGHNSFSSAGNTSAEHQHQARDI